jgi:hypothetical protein
VREEHKTEAEEEENHKLQQVLNKLRLHKLQQQQPPQAHDHKFNYLNISKFCFNLYFDTYDYFTQ